MKILQVVVGFIVLGIFAFCIMLMYSQYQYYIIATDKSRYSFDLTNEFYLVTLSTLVLTFFSIPTLIYQIKSLIQTGIKTNKALEDDDLIDGDNVLIKEKQGPGKFLHGSTKLYAFALLTEVILVGKRSTGVLSRLDRMDDWLLLGGFVLAMFTAIYFLAIDRADKKESDSE